MSLDSLHNFAAARVNHTNVAERRRRHKTVGEEARPEEFAEAAKLTNRNSEPLREVCQVVDVDLAVDTGGASHRLGC